MAQLLSPVSFFNSTQLHSDNTFSLKSFTEKIGIFVDFQTQFSISNSQNSQLYLSSLPTFNVDKKYFTPAFTLKSSTLDFNSSMKNEQQSLSVQLESFERKKASYIQSPNQTIYQAKPESYYCQICQQSFDDYKKHIDHPVHAKKLKDGRIQPEIHNLIQHFHIKNSTSLKRAHPSLSNVQKSQKTQKYSQQAYFKSSKKVKKDKNDKQLSLIHSNLTLATKLSF